MKSAIAKYEHVVQCLRELKLIYRDGEMFETVLSPHTVNFLRSHAIYKSCQKRQSFFRAMWWETVETEDLSLKGTEVPVAKEGVCFHTGVLGLSPNLC